MFKLHAALLVENKPPPPPPAPPPPPPPTPTTEKAQFENKSKNLEWGRRGVECGGEGKSC